MNDWVFGVHRLTGFAFQPRRAGASPDVGELAASQFIQSAIEALPVAAHNAILTGDIFEGYNPAKLSKEWLGYRWLDTQLAEMRERYKRPFEPVAGENRAPDDEISLFPAFHWTVPPPAWSSETPVDGFEVFVGRDFAVVNEFSISPRGVGSGPAAASRTESRFPDPPSPASALFRATAIQICGRGASAPDGWQPEQFAKVGPYLGKQHRNLGGVMNCAIESHKRRYRVCFLADPGRAGVDDFTQDAFRYYLNASSFFRALATLLTNHAKVLYELEVAERDVPTITRRFEDLRLLVDGKPYRNRPLTKPGPEAIKKEAAKIIPVLISLDQVVTTCELNGESFQSLGRELIPGMLWAKDEDDRINYKTKELSRQRDDIRRIEMALSNDIRDLKPTVLQQIGSHLEFVVGCTLPLGLTVAIEGDHPFIAMFFILVSAFLGLIKFCTWDEHRTWPGLTKWAAFVLVFAMIAGISCGLIIYAFRPEK